MPYPVAGKVAKRIESSLAGRYGLRTGAETAGARGAVETRACGRHNDAAKANQRIHHTAYRRALASE